MIRCHYMANKASTTKTTFCSDSRMVLALDWFPSSIVMVSLNRGEH